MANAYIYARFSTKAQDKGSSIERQLEITRRYCADKGWHIVDTFWDKGRSAWKGDHLRVGALGKFRERIDAGEIERGSNLVIENLDRLSRMEVKRARRWIEEVTEAGVNVAVCNLNKVFDEDSLSGDNIVDLLQYLLEAKRSHGESSRKSELQQDAIGRFMTKARRGIVYTARMPAWLEGEKNGKFIIREDRALVINRIYEWSASGLGFQSIAKKLNETIEPWTQPLKSSKSSWKAGYIRDILTTPIVEGEYHVKRGPDRVPTGEVILGYYPRIVPADLVERARHAQKGRQGITGPNHSEARNLFAGRIKCAHCGDTMLRVVQRNSQGRQYEYLKCVRFNNGADCVNTTMYRYDVFEKAALERILHLALDNTHFVKTDEVGPLNLKLAETKKQVEQLEKEYANLLTLIRKFGEDEAVERDILELRPRLASLKVERDNAQERLDAARGTATPEEHLRRVREVKDAIYSEDDEERTEARRKVRDAIQTIVQVVQCRRDYPKPVPGQKVKRTPERQIMMTLAGGLQAFQFDNEGNLLKRIDMSSLPDHMLTGLQGTGADQAIRDIKRRRTA